MASDPDTASNVSLTSGDANENSVKSQPRTRRSRSSTRFGDTGSDVASNSGLNRSGKEQSPGGTSVDTVRVICRVRPFNNREIELQKEIDAAAPEWERFGLRSVITMEGEATQFLDHKDNFCMKEQFRFDDNLWSIPKEQQDTRQRFADQAGVFDKVGVPTLNHTMEGYNTCIFAYGQTGAGKTYTMMGFDGEERGLIPRTCEALFDRVRAAEADATSNRDDITVTFRVEATFLEIYNEHVKDLLFELGDAEQQAAERWDSENLKVRHVPGQGPYVVGLTHVKVSSWEQCEKLLTVGTDNRSMAATNMNERSSRSHALFRLMVTQVTTIKSKRQFEKPKVAERTAQINLVDLAGSERNKKSGAQGVRLKEAAAINQSLTTLKRVIDALVENRDVIPYRESQLTWLLSESLGGNSKTFTMACVSPHVDNAEETLNTLRYALRTQGIVCNARVNESDESKRIHRLRRELETAQERLQNAADGNGDLHVELKRKADEGRVAIAELQRSRFVRQNEQQELEEEVEKQDHANFVSRYSHAFRQVLTERMTRRMQMEADQGEVQITVLTTDIGRREDQMAGISRRLKESKNDESDALMTLKRKQRHLKEIQEKHTELEERAGNLDSDESDIKLYIRHHQGLLRLTRFVATGIAAAEDARLRNRLGKAIENDNVTITAHKAAQDERMENSVDEHSVQLASLRGRIDALRKEIAQRRFQSSVMNITRQNKIRKLHEAAIFFERENGTLDGDHVSDMTKLDRERRSKFDSEKLQWKEKIAQIGNSRGAEYNRMQREMTTKRNALKSEGNRSVREAHEVGKEDFSKVTDGNSASLSAVESSWAKKIDEMNQQVTDTQRYIAKYKSNSRRIAEFENMIKTAEDWRVARQRKSHKVTSTAPDAATMLDRLAQLMQQSLKQRSHTPSRFASVDEQRAANEAAQEAMVFPPEEIIPTNKSRSSSVGRDATQPRARSIETTNYASVNATLCTFRNLPEEPTSGSTSARSVSPGNTGFSLPLDQVERTGSSFGKNGTGNNRITLPTSPPSYMFSRTRSASAEKSAPRPTYGRRMSSTNLGEQQVSTTTPRVMRVQKSEFGKRK